LRNAAALNFVRPRANGRSIGFHVANLQTDGMQEPPTMAKEIFRVVTRGTDGKLRVRDYPKADAIQRLHTQIGIDDCSTDLELRGQPVFKGLIGPMPEGSNVVRYESPEVFETLTKEWVASKGSRRNRARQSELESSEL
jgi:hypothetical protein